MSSYLIPLLLLISTTLRAAPPENGDFESGDFAFWAPLQGTAWEVVDFDHPNRQGRFYASTCDRVWPGDGGCRDGAGEADTGVLASHVFTLSLPYIHFRLAGFNGPKCERDTNYLRLRLADTHAVLHQTKVPCQNPFESHFWDVSPWLGERVYLAAEDGDDESGWAWIAVDDVRFEEGPPAPPGALEDFAVDALAGRITFTSRRDGGEYLYGMPAGGGAVVPLRYGGGKSFHPAWSADGRLAFVSGRRIHLFDGLRVRALTPPSSAAHHPAWSADGRLAYVAAPDGLDDLYELDLPSGTVRRLTQAMGVSQPSWSADGRRIAFAAGGDIWAVEPQTAGLERLVGGAAWEGFPAYAPTGRRLAYVSEGELHMLEADGGARQLTRGFAFVSDPAFSPGGRYVAFASERGGGQDLFLLELASGRVKQLTQDPADDFEPVFFAGEAFPARPTAVASAVPEPAGVRLAPNYPNPFNAETVVPYVLPRAGAVRMDVYDMVGQKVRTLVRGWRPAGAHAVFWDGRGDDGRAVASGGYTCRLEAAGAALFGRMLLVR